VRDPDSGWIQLDTIELFLLWSGMGLGDLPPVLGVPHVGRTRRRRAELISSASAALGARGLGSVESPARDLAGMLRVLAEREVSLDVRVYGDGEPLFGYAGSRGRTAAALARVGDEVRVGPVTPGTLIGPLLGSLAPLPPGPDRPANVSAADLETAFAEAERDGTAGFQRALSHAGVRASEAATVSRVLSSRQAHGQLGVTGRDRRWLNWVDTPEGRYALRQNGSWVTLTPVDLPRLSAMAEEMLDEVR
jgi:ESX secretion-associated protein EspG